MTNSESSDFLERIRARTQRMKQEAEELTSLLGLPNEAKYDVLAVLYGQAQTIQEEFIVANIPPQGFTRLPGSERQLPANARQIGPVDPQENIEVSVYLRDPATSTDQTPHAGQCLNRSAYSSLHQADPNDLAKAEAFAHQHHLTVVEADPVMRKVVLAGSATAMMKAFGTELHRYEHKGSTFRGRTGHLHLPNELEQIVVGVFGLDDRPQAHPLHLREARQPVYALAAASPKIWYTPSQVAQIYNFPLDLDGRNECIALIELGGGYKDQDLATYFQQLGTPTPQVVGISVDGALSSPIGDCTQVALDIEVAGGVAPQARIAVYFAPNTDRGFLDAITQAIHDPINAPSVISISWGSAESNWTSQSMQLIDQAFQTAGRLGITVCCASGDNGSGDGRDNQLAHVDFPASSPHVLACGGTRLDAVWDQSTNALAWKDEVVWNDGADGGATGGGVSDSFGLPIWQTDAHVPRCINDGHMGRGVPDIAGHADPQSGYLISFKGESLTIGGTGAVAPLWAGLIACLNQKLGQPIGFLNPLLYQNYASLIQSQALHAITSGNNGSYSAGPGWNACTGLGTPDGKRLLDALTSSRMEGK